MFHPIIRRAVRVSFACLVGLPALTASMRAAEGPANSRRVPAQTNAAPAETAAAAAPLPPLPPAPTGVTDLKFSELCRLPVGPLGLEFTDRARALDGQKVRMLGYMIRQSQPSPWKILFSPVPMTLHEKEYGFAEDLPPTVVHAFTERHATPIVPFTPGLLLLTGRLELGNRTEPDGRISSVRLFLDPPTAEQRKALNAAASGLAPLSTNAVMETKPSP
jgi:hypothetical protein